MFENLTGRLSEAARSLSGKGRITESNIKDTLRQVRLALLEADVALPVVKSFVDRIREKAVGEEVSKSLTPGQALVKSYTASWYEYWVRSTRRSISRHSRRLS